MSSPFFVVSLPIPLTPAHVPSTSKLRAGMTDVVCFVVTERTATHSSF